MAPQTDPNNNNLSNPNSGTTRLEMPSTEQNASSSSEPSSARAQSSPNRSHMSASNILGSSNSASAQDYLYFDANTFKQVKRLYCGMLMVAMAYSVTMIIMMVVLYKTLPQSMTALQAGSSPFVGSPLMDSSGTNAPKYRSPFGINPSISETEPALGIFAGEKTAMQQLAVGTSGPAIGGSHGPGTGGVFRGHDGRIVTHETARTYLDQVIAINFLTLILYSLAFYAAHRELYTLTLAFTSTLSFTMLFSVVKIFVEGVHFPNNFMSLLLRVSIVFVALVYLGQLRRKQHFIRNMWLSPNSLLNHPALRSSQMTPTQTAQLIRDFLASQSGAGSSAFKTDDELMNEYQDQPPNYEEALRCPMPNGASVTSPHPAGSVIPMRPISSSASLPTRAGSQLTLGPPPSFEELQSSRPSLTNSSTISITVPETLALPSPATSTPESHSLPKPNSSSTVINVPQ